MNNTLVIVKYRAHYVLTMAPLRQRIVIIYLQYAQYYNMHSFIYKSQIFHKPAKILASFTIQHMPWHTQANGFIPFPKLFIISLIH